MLTARATIIPRIALRAPVATMTRFYSPDVPQSGATATSQGFRKREEAEEGQYIRKREVEKLKAAQDRLDKAQKDVEDAKKRVEQSK